jgi:hypothetical protein
VFGPKARRRPETLRIVERLAMEAILPLLGKRSGRISTAPSHQPIRRRRRDESEEKQVTVSASKSPTTKGATR